MRKILSLVLAVVLMSSVSFAQFSNIKQTAREKGSIKVPSTAVVENNKSTNAVIWSDDFSVASNWSISDNGANGSWTISSTIGATLISYGLTEFASTSGPDFAVFDSDGAGSGANNTDLITVNPIDCSAETFVTLKFESYAAEYASSVFTVHVSTDGTSYTQVAELYPDLAANTGTANPEYEEFDISALAAGESTVYIKFNFQGDYDYFWAIDDVSLESGAPINDAGVAAITAPTNASGCTLTGAESISVDIANTGNQDLTGFDVNYRINEGAVVTETYTGSIVAGTTENFTFATTADFSALAHYSLEAWTTVTGDADSSNDTTATMLANGDATITLHITPDSYPEEVYYGVLNSAGDVVYIGGPAADMDPGLANGVETTIDVCAISTECYTVVIGDSYGDGGTTFSVDYNGTQAGAVAAADYTSQASVFPVGEGCPADDVAIVDITNSAVSTPGSISITGTVVNYGTDALTSYDVVYTIDGGTPSNVYSVTGINIATGQTHDFTHDVPYVATAGSVVLEITVSNPNGNTDANDVDNVASKTLTFVTNMRSTMLEYFTTEQCPNCPPSAAVVSAYAASNDNVIMIAHHAGYYTDPFTITENEDLLVFFNDGGSTFAPASMNDRHYWNADMDNDGTNDPGPVYWPGNTTANCYACNGSDSRLAVEAEVSVEFDGNYNTATNELNITVSGDFLADVTGSLGLGLFIVENNVPESSADAQSGAASGYIHKHVMRDAISGDVYGVSDAFTTTNTGDTYTRSFTYTVDAGWNYDELSLVGFVSNLDAAQVNNRDILNAGEIMLSDIPVVNISSINDANFNIYPNPSTGLVKIEGVEGAQVLVYNMIGEVVYNESNAAATTTMDLSSLNAGNYIVKVINNNEVATQKIVLTK